MSYSIKTKASLSALIASTTIPASLVRAVVRQMGGWTSFASAAPDIYNHGIDGGFSGFIWNADTEAFAKRNRADIAQMAESIFTKGIPATNTKPQRIQARTTAGIKLTLSWHSPELDPFDDQHSSTPAKHAYLARKLADSLDWRAPLIQGSADNNGGYVFVLLPQPYIEAVRFTEEFARAQLPTDFQSYKETAEHIAATLSDGKGVR